MKSMVKPEGHELHTPTHTQTHVIDIDIMFFHL